MSKYGTWTCEGCGMQVGPAHVCKDEGTRLTTSLAAANQQLDAMRAEHKNCAHWKAECETAQAEAERLTVLKEELKRIAIEEVEGIEAERDAMRAELDEWKGTAQIAQEDFHAECGTVRKLERELAAMRAELTETRGLLETERMNATEYATLAKKTAEEARELETELRAELAKVQRLLNVEREGRVQLYQGNPNKSSRVKTHAVSCECVGCYEQTVVDRDQTILSLRAELADLRQSTEADAKPVSRLREVLGPLDGEDVEPVPVTSEVVAWRIEPRNGTEPCLVFDPMLWADAVKKTPLYEHPAPVAPVSAKAWLVKDADGTTWPQMHKPQAVEGRAATPLYAAPSAPARTLVRDWYEDANGDPMEPGVTRHPDGTKAKRVRRWKLGTRGRK